MILPEYDAKLISFYKKNIGTGNIYMFLFHLIEHCHPINQQVLAKSTAFLQGFSSQKTEEILRLKNKDGHNIFGYLIKCMEKRIYDKDENSWGVILSSYLQVKLEAANADNLCIEKKGFSKGKEKE